MNCSTMLLAVLATCSLLLAPAASAARPNVLFIAVDDLNDWVGCLNGHPQAQTPNIDRLAERGTLFTNAHCQGPICGPSRASLLSGCYPHTTGVYQQPGGKLDRDEKHFRGHLLPEVFASHGYETLSVGKITHGYKQDVAFQIDGGNKGPGPKPPNPDTNRFNWHLPDVPYTGTQTDWGAFPERDEQMPDHQAATWAEARLKEPRTKPFFLAVGFNRPHVPWYVPQKWFDRFPVESIELPPVRDDDFDDIPAIGRAIHELPKYPNLAFLQKDDNKQFRLCVQAYLASTTFVDHQVGRVLDALNASPYAKNTIIVLFSDHGYHLGEKDRVSKHSLWEESTRVPLAIVTPGGKAGQRCARPVGLIDLYPTLLQLCGLPERKRNEGMSLVPLLADPKSKGRFAILTTYAHGNHSLRGERYHYIRYEDGSEELYDHKTDAHEWTNLLAGKTEDGKRAAVVTRFRKALPKKEVPYHSSTKTGAVNAWFEKHLETQGVR